MFALILTATPFSFAQTTQGDWNAVQKLAAGTDLFIKTTNGKTVKGSLVNVKTDEVEVSVKRRNSALPKNTIEAIYLAVPKSGKRTRLIGAAIGFLAGGVVAGALNRDEDNYSALVLFPIAGLVGGTYIGSRFGNGWKKGVLIYKVK